MADQLQSLIAKSLTKAKSRHLALASFGRMQKENKGRVLRAGTRPCLALEKG